MKDGMEYFPHDTDACSDEKIESLRFLHGNDGYAFYFILLERIYRNRSYSCDVSAAETTQILASKLGLSLDKFNAIMETALRLGCFDRDEFEKNKRLTSRGIMKRAQSVQAKRDRQRGKTESVIAAETTQKLDDNHTETPERKAKESKGKQREELPELPPSVDVGTKSEKKARPKKAPADATDARANPWALWVDVNREYGRADPAALGPDLKAAKELGKATKDDNELRACMFAYLDDKDAFIAKQGWPMRLMCSRLNGYLNPVDPLGEYTWSDEDYIEQGKSCKRITVMLVRAFKATGKQNPNCPVTQGHLDAFAFWEKEGTLDT